MTDTDTAAPDTKGDVIICTAYDGETYLGWCDVVHDDDSEATEHLDELNAEGEPYAGLWQIDTEANVAAMREAEAKAAADEAAPEPEPAPSRFASMKVAELRAEATLVGVSSSGKKADLVERLEAHEAATDAG